MLAFGILLYDLVSDMVFISVTGNLFSSFFLTANNGGCNRCFYIPQYPLRGTAQTCAVHFTPGRPIYYGTNLTSQGSILAKQQLLLEDFTPTAVYSQVVIYIVEMAEFRNSSRGDSNPHSIVNCLSVQA